MAFVACGGDETKPGEGPAFPAGTTAGYFWNLVSLEPYVPKNETGTFDCVGGGTATVKYEIADFTETTEITYDKCVGLHPGSGSSSPDLAQTGTAKTVLRRTSLEEGSYSQEQHVSFSGEIGLLQIAILPSSLVRTIPSFRAEVARMSILRGTNYRLPEWKW